MKKLLVGLVVLLSASLITIVSCSDKNSTEACQYATTLNLDKGNYDAVLQSPCATPMHLGAAYFGKAGYSVTNVINVLITAQTTSANSALQQYMNVLTRKVSPDIITFLDDSQAKYLSIPPSSDLHQSAQFDLSIVLAVKAVSLLKTVIDLNGLGTLSACDINGNSKPDEADAMICSLLVSGTTLTGGVCPAPLASFATYTTKDITFSSITGTYKGLTSTMTGTATGSCPAEYKKLLYLSTSDSSYHAATTSGMCPVVGGEMWPCPVTSQIDLVATLDNSISTSITALNTAISGTAAAEVVQAIEDIKTQACGSLVSTCTATTIADYIQNHL